MALSDRCRSEEYGVFFLKGKTLIRWLMAKNQNHFRVYCAAGYVQIQNKFLHILCALSATMILPSKISPFMPHIKNNYQINFQVPL